MNIYSTLSAIGYRKIGIGAPIVLIHGFPTDGTIWQTIWQQLSKQYTVIVPDLPGIGLSENVLFNSIEDLAVCINYILELENIDEITVAGHSMGGYIALAFAHLFPEKTNGISLIHSTTYTDTDEKKLNRYKAIKIIEKGGKEAFVKEMVLNLFGLEFKKNNEQAVLSQISHSLQIADQSLMSYYKAMADRNDYLFLLQNANYPIHWVIGGKDAVLPANTIFSQSHKSSINFISYYSECGHMSMLEKPNTLSQDLINFLNYCNVNS